MEDTNFIGNSSDDIATHVNASTSFIKKHSKEVHDFKVLFRDYVKGLYPQNQNADGGNIKAADSGNAEAASGGNVETADTARGEAATTHPLPASVYPSLAGIDLNALSK
jgi:hypothetical protein